MKQLAPGVAQAVLELVPDGVFIVRRDGRIAAVNTSGTDMFGYSRDELVGTTIDILVPRGAGHDHAAKRQSYFERPVRRTMAAGRRLRGVRKDGTEFPVEIALTPFESEGELVVIASVRDATERTQTDDALRRSENRFRRIFEAALCGLLVVDTTGRILEANDTFLELLGFTRSDLQSGAVRWDALTPKEHAHLDARALEEATASGSCTPYEKEYIRKDGSHVPVIVCGTLLDGEDPDHGKLGVGFVLDLTAIKRAEKAAHRAEEQLRQVQKMDAIGRLAGGVAHDFNNLMTAVIGYSDLALDGLRENDPLRKTIEQVKKAGERATALTRQLLAFSRKQVLEPKIVSFNPIVNDIEKMLRRLLGENIDVSVTLAPDLWNVTADPSQLEQVIVNLAVNARDAMPKGGKLTIETQNVTLDANYAPTHAEVVPGDYVMFAVTDTGIGMNAGALSHLFEPFFTTKKGIGTGLGLSTVHGIVKQSGGQIWVYSEPGKGTTFKVYFPRTEADATPVAGTRAATATARGSETILLVEDEEMVRLLAMRVLASYGYTVLEAANGGEALLLAERFTGTIALMLTDVVLPSMTGRELAGRLAPLRPTMRVLYMSGYTEHAIVHHGTLDPGTAFIQKPFTSAALAERVRSTLDAQ